MDKSIKMLIENKMFDGSICVFCTKWNAFIGAKYVTVYENNLYITPILGGVYGVDIKKSIKINKQEITDIKVKKSFWTGSKLIITLNNGKEFKYTLVNGSWVEPANKLVNSWFLKK